MTVPIDYHLERLGTYLKERLNEAGAALSFPFTVIEDVSYLTDFNPLDKFPLLQIYRTGGKNWEGEEIQDWEINYCLTNYADVYDVPKILAWIVEGHNTSNIRALLVNYFSSGDNCGSIDLQSIKWSYGYKILGANKVPSVRIEFTLLP
jgi:hypothetical protein